MNGDVRPAWSPASIAALVIGVGLLVGPNRSIVIALDGSDGYDVVVSVTSSLSAATGRVLTRTREPAGHWRADIVVEIPMTALLLGFESPSLLVTLTSFEIDPTGPARTEIDTAVAPPPMIVPRLHVTTPTAGAQPGGLDDSNVTLFGNAWVSTTPVAAVALALDTVAL